MGKGSKANKGASYETATPVPHNYPTGDNSVHEDADKVDSNGRKMSMHTQPGALSQVNVHGRNMVLDNGADGKSQTLTKADRLGAAALNGDVAKVKKLVKSGVDPNYVNNTVGAPAICIAAEFASPQHLDIVKVLVGAKANMDASGKDGITAVMMAVQFSRLPMLKFLLESKANVNLRCHSWPTRPRDASPLDIAARHNRADAMKLLLLHGAQVDAQSKMGVSALSCASAAGSVDCCKILLDAKANPMLADRSGGSALQIASEPQDGKTNPCLPDLLIAANAPEHWVTSARAAINAGVPIPEELPADDTVLLRREPSAPSSEPEHDDPAVDALRLAAMGLDLNQTGEDIWRLEREK